MSWIPSVYQLREQRLVWMREARLMSLCVSTLMPVIKWIAQSTFAAGITHILATDVGFRVLMFQPRVSIKEHKSHSSLLLLILNAQCQPAELKSVASVSIPTPIRRKLHRTMAGSSLKINKRNSVCMRTATINLSTVSSRANWTHRFWRSSGTNTGSRPFPLALYSTTLNTSQMPFLISQWKLISWSREPNLEELQVNLTWNKFIRRVAKMRLVYPRTR